MAMWICLLFITVLGVPAESCPQVQPANFPVSSVVELVYKGSNETHSCNGVIIPRATNSDKTYFLTAAHCTINRHKDEFLTPNRAYCGHYDTRPSEQQGDTFVQFTGFPAYFTNQPEASQPALDTVGCVSWNNRCHWPHDISLWEINDACNGGTRIPVYTGPIANVRNQNGICWIAGWQGDSSCMKIIPVTIKDGTEFGMNGPPSQCLLDSDGSLANHVVCTYTAECIAKGLSGGPLICIEGGEYKLVAIVSRRPGECEDNKPTSHTIVQYFSGGIAAITGTLQ